MADLCRISAHYLRRNERHGGCYSSSEHDSGRGDGLRFFLPFNSAPNLIFYATDRFTVAQELKGAIPLAILIVIGLIFSVLVWFPIIGIL